MANGHTKPRDAKASTAVRSYENQDRVLWVRIRGCEEAEFTSHCTTVGFFPASQGTSCEGSSWSLMLTETLVCRVSQGGGYPTCFYPCSIAGWEAECLRVGGAILTYWRQCKLSFGLVSPCLWRACHPKVASSRHLTPV